MRTALIRRRRMGGAGVFAPDWFVDSVAGDDGNDGTTLATAKQTIAGLMALPIEAGQVLGLVSGSSWREMLKPSVSVTAMVVGSGDMPILDGAVVIDPGDISASLHADAAGVVYEVTLSRDPDGVWVSGDTYMIWEDGVFLTRVTSVAACAALPGSMYIAQPNALATPSVAHFHPFGSTNATSDGKLYEYSEKAAVLETASLTGVRIEGIAARRGASAYGSAAGGLDAEYERCLFALSGKHNLVFGSGSVRDCIAFGGEKARSVLADGGRIPMTAYRASTDGLSYSVNRSMAIMPSGQENTSQALYAHNGSGALYTTGDVTGFANNGAGDLTPLSQASVIRGCYSLNNRRAVNIPAKSTNSTFSHFQIRGISDPANTPQVLHPSAGAIAGGEIIIEHGCVYTPTVTSVQGAIVSGQVASQYHFRNNIFLLEGGGTMFNSTAAIAGSTVTDNIFIFNTSGVHYWMVVSSSVASDYNVFIQMQTMTDIWWQTPGSGTAFNLTEWRSESGQDLNSIEAGTTELNDLFLGGVAGLRNGDFRLNPASTVLFADGTPVVSRAGVREYYDWTSDSIVAGQPASWPTIPTTEAECMTYLQSPETWWAS